MVILFTSALLRNDSAVPELMLKEKDFELLRPENLSLPFNGVRFTSILKTKGMEWEVVYLVCDNLSDADLSFQLFIGASRAKGRVYLVHGE